ncbi:xylulokinase [Roseibacillus ishigakijimensis]|uniref:Carbohydrate kinase n=1 Tax=Roseibacillus ishigakijimensis TaxID=454146 RepID=A0A934RRV3_9BACT|nr:FGGY-family carbohydrate kinase [Roseibacillus ishigakijimensis]MBK1833100.1 carbohydrate kinase [Roseibacillus ishigakijimensis]
MSLVLGLDSSTQSLSALILDTAEGKIVAEASVSFGKDLPQYGMPSGFLPGGRGGEVHSSPLMWLDALDAVFRQLQLAGAPLDKVEAVSGSGQQHGSVYLKNGFNHALSGLQREKSLADQLAPVLARETSPIWMDTSTTAQCAEIGSALGGAEEVCRRSGSVPIERFTGPQIRKFFQTDPDGYAATGSIHLVSSFLASVLAGKSVAIDTGDGAGMNLMNLVANDWDEDLLAATAPELRRKLPAVAPADTVAGPVSSYFTNKYNLNPSCQVVLWTGDNPSSLVGMGAAQPGKVVISLGTSDTLFAAMSEPRTDPRGFGHVFGNPMGGNMSLICFLNGSLAREAVKDRFDLSWEDFDVAGLARSEPALGGRVILPFVGNEITPRVNSTDFIPVGFAGEPTADEWVRGVIEGQFLNMKRHSDWLGVETEEVLLTGGASENNGIAQIVADIFGKKVRRLSVAGSAALGAALRAAVARGDDLSTLEEAFSAPAEGRDVLPREEYATVYRQLEEKFAEALKNRFDLA